MSDKPDDLMRLRTLVDALLENRLTQDEENELEQLVLNNPAARKAYVEMVHEHASLQWWIGSQPDFASGPHRAQASDESDDEILIPTPRPKSGGSVFWRRTRRVLLYVGSCAAMLVIGLIFGFERGEEKGKVRGPVVAHLIDAKECRWSGATVPTDLGSQLPAGRLRLASGLAKLRFTSGAEVTLEGPADFEIISPMKCRLLGGRMVADVPQQAIGFAVDTPEAEVIDQGTQFGVHVQGNGISDVQVFDGLVDVKHRDSGNSTRLDTGKYLRVAPASMKELDVDAVGLESPPLQPEAPRSAEKEATRRVMISTAQGRGRDVYIQSRYPRKNTSDTLLLIKNEKREDKGFWRKAYLGFDVDTVRGRKIKHARLDLTFQPTNLGFVSGVPDSWFSIYGLTEESLDGWRANDMRWNNAPGNGPGPAGVDKSNTVLVGRFMVPQGTDVGNFSIAGKPLVDFLNSKTNGRATFIIVRETSGNDPGQDYVHGIASRYHPTAKPPTLSLVVERASPSSNNALEVDQGDNN